MYIFDSGPTVANCILWQDSAPQGPEIYIDDSSLMSVTYSDIQGGEALVFVEPGGTLNWGDGNIDGQPLFVDADGPDEILGTQDDDLRLLPGSPCIDAGDNTAVPADELDLDGDNELSEPLPFDLDSNPRFFDDTCTFDSGIGDPPVVDMGAYEFQGVPGDIDGLCSVSVPDLLLLLAAWGPCPAPPDPCPADIDLDGTVGVADLLILLANWGLGPS